MNVPTNLICPDTDLLVNRLGEVAPWSEMEDGTKFDNIFYLVTHLDVLVHGADPYQHYLSHGKREGRQWKAFDVDGEAASAEDYSEEVSIVNVLVDRSKILNRQTFAQLAMRTKRNLEIGPFTAPLLRGEGVFYADVLDSEALHERAIHLGLDPKEIPSIDYVVQATNLSTISGKFDSVLSSHVIEHLPDLVSHLNQVSELLNDGGRYFLLIPDHRYCFDHFQTESTIADVLHEHKEKREIHSLKSIINSQINLTHNDSESHWNGEHGRRNDSQVELIRSVLDGYGNGIYIDCHAWYFNPENWKKIISTLKTLGIIEFELEFLQETQTKDIEFYSILRKL